MALFEGEQLVDVDVGGRVMKVPASVAAQLTLPPVQSAVAEYGLLPGTHLPKPPPPPPPPPDQKVGPGPVPIIAPIGELPPAGPVVPLPRSVVGAPEAVADPNATSPTTGDYRAGTGEQLVKEMKERAAEKAKAPKAPTETEQLQHEGYGGAYADQVAANKTQQMAVLNTANVEAAGQDRVAGVLADRNRQLDKLFAAREKQAQADLAAIQKRIVDYDAATKKYADTKIDRKADHPMMGLVGAVLAGLGMAMMGKGAEENPAIKALHQAIDRKVAGQMADLEKQGKVLGFQKEAIENMRTQAKDQLAFKNLMIAGETERAARYMEEMGARTNSEVIKARAIEGAAALRARAADLKMVAADKQTESDHKARDRAQRDMENKRSVGVQYARISEDKRQFDKTFEQNKERLDLEAAKLFQATEAAGNKERMKEIKEADEENRKTGIRNVVTAEPLLNAKGNALFGQAEQVDAEATKLENAAKDQANQGALSGKPDEGTYQKQMAHVEALRTKAQQLRAEGRTFGQVRHRDATQAGRTSAMYASAQGMTNLNDEIQSLYEGKSFGKTDADRVAIRSKMTEWLMKQKNVWQLGVLSKQDTQLLREAGISDPTNVDVDYVASVLTDKMFGKDGDAFRAGLNSLAKSAREDTMLELRAQTDWDGKDPDKLFVIKKPEAADPQAATRQSIMEDSTVEEKVRGEKGGGVIREIASAPILPRSMRPDTESERKAEARGSEHKEYKGFTQKQGEHVGYLLKSWKQNDDQKASDRAAKELVALTKSDRIDLKKAALATLRRESGLLFDRALAELPADDPVKLNYELSETHNTMVGLDSSMSRREMLEQLAKHGSAGAAEALRTMK